MSGLHLPVEAARACSSDRGPGTYFAIGYFAKGPGNPGMIQVRLGAMLPSVEEINERIFAAPTLAGVKYKQLGALSVLRLCGLPSSHLDKISPQTGMRVERVKNRVFVLPGAQHRPVERSRNLKYNDDFAGLYHKSLEKQGMPPQYPGTVLLPVTPAEFSNSPITEVIQAAPTYIGQPLTVALRPGLQDIVTIKQV